MSGRWERREDERREEKTKNDAHRARWPSRHCHRRQHIGKADAHTANPGTDSVMFTTELRVRKRRLRSAEGDVARPTATRAHTRQPWAGQRQPPQNCAAGHEHTPRPRETKGKATCTHACSPSPGIEGQCHPCHWQKPAQHRTSRPTRRGKTSTDDLLTTYSQANHQVEREELQAAAGAHAKEKSLRPSLVVPLSSRRQ